MALNFPGPYEARINYTVGIYEHVARLNFSATTNLTTGTDYNTIDCNTKGGGTRSLASAVTSYANAIKPFLAAANSEITSVEVWKIEPESYQGTFITSATISIAGTSAAATAFGSQLMMTFRTGEGGILKANVLNSTTPAGLPILQSNFTTNLNIWADEFRGSTSVWLGRDTSYVISVLKCLPGQNEALFKRVYRS